MAKEIRYEQQSIHRRLRYGDGRGRGRVAGRCGSFVAGASVRQRTERKKQSILQSLGAQDRNYDDFISAYVLDAEGQRIEGRGCIRPAQGSAGRLRGRQIPASSRAADGRVVLPVTGTGLGGRSGAAWLREKDMDTVAGIIMAATRGGRRVWAPRSLRRSTSGSSSARRSSRATSSARSRSSRAVLTAMRTASTPFRAVRRPPTA